LVRRVGLIPIIHVIVGVVMVLLVITSTTQEGDPGVLFAIVNHGTGLVAYRDYPVEYPPLGFAALRLPLLLGGTSAPTYQTVFSLVSVLLALATAACVYWLARHRWGAENPARSVVLYAGLALAAAPLVVWRFDILPAFLTAIALVAYAARRPGFSGLALGLGIVAKVYPAFLVPVFACAKLFERLWRDAAVLVLAAGIAVAAVLGEVYLVAGSRVFYFLVYQRNRGVEIESVAGGLAMLAGSLGQVPAKVVVEFGSMQVDSVLLTSLAGPVFALEVISGVALVAAMLFSFRRDVGEMGAVQPMTIVQYSLATLLLVMLANKVLSPQYVVWVLPFVPLLGVRKSVLFLVIVVLTTVEYPLSFRSLVHLEAVPTIVVNIRNALLVAFFVWIVIPRRVTAWAALASGVAGLKRGYVRDPAD
jgi:hypothetical protein